jgi:hypothetical protein
MTTTTTSIEALLARRDVLLGERSGLFQRTPFDPAAARRSTELDDELRRWGREFRAACGRLSLDELRAQRAVLQQQQARDVATIGQRSRSPFGDSQPERDALYQRINSRREIIEAIGPVEYEMRTQRAHDAAVEWGAGAAAAHLYQRWMETEGLALEPTAALTIGWESAVAAGAGGRHMPSLPAMALARLREYKATVIAVRRHGVALDLKRLPESVRRFIEAA